VGWKTLKHFGLVLIGMGLFFIINSASGITGMAILRDLKVEVSLNLGVGFVLSGVVFFAVGNQLGERLGKKVKKRR